MEKNTTDIILQRCFNGGSCEDGVDSFTCSCSPGFSGINCECPVDGGDCINVNETVSWTVPPFSLVTEEEEGEPTVDEVDRADREGEEDKGKEKEGEEGSTEISPTPTLKGDDGGSVLKPTEIDGTTTAVPSSPPPAATATVSSPVTSQFIYELSSGEVSTRSFILTSPVSEGSDVTGTERSTLEPTPVMVPTEPTGVSTVPVTVVTQTVDVVSTATYSPSPPARDREVSEPTSSSIQVVTSTCSESHEIPG